MPETASGSKLDDWFFTGIADDGVAFRRSGVGQVTTIEDFDRYGHAELRLASSCSPGGCCGHTIWVDVAWLEKV